MIGIALVTFVAVLANGMKASNRAAIEEQVAADYVVTSQDGYTPFVAAAGEALAAPGRRARHERPLRARRGRRLRRVRDRHRPGRRSPAGVQLRLGGRLGRRARELGRNGAIVDDAFADDQNLAVGDTFTL